MIDPFVIFWLVCGIVNYGIVLDYFQRTWPKLAYRDRISDRILSVLTSLAGPVALVYSLLFYSLYRWRL